MLSAVPDPTEVGMDTAVRDKALETLDNMATQVRAERVQAALGAYIEPEKDDEVGMVVAACNGHRMCLVGSMYIAHGDAVIAGIEPRPDSDLLWGVLDGVDNCEREEYLAQRPALAAVYEAIDEEARALYEERGEALSLRNPLIFPYFAEALFEGGDLTHDDLLDLIGRCRRRIAEGLVEA